MPLYELFCMVRPGLETGVVANIMRTAGRTVLSSGGVLTDVKSFGEQPTAYPIRRPGEKYEETHMWQMTFAAKTEALRQIDHDLRVNEDVLRWIVMKRKMLTRLPNSHRVSRLAELASQQEAVAAAADAAPAAAAAPQQGA